jgi:hypothetical protein
MWTSGPPGPAGANGGSCAHAPGLGALVQPEWTSPCYGGPAIGIQAGFAARHLLVCGQPFAGLQIQTPVCAASCPGRSERPQARLLGLAAQRRLLGLRAGRRRAVCRGGGQLPRVFAGKACRCRSGGASCSPRLWGSASATARTGGKDGLRPAAAMGVIGATKRVRQPRCRRSAHEGRFRPNAGPVSFGEFPIGEFPNAMSRGALDSSGLGARSTPMGALLRHSVVAPKNGLYQLTALHKTTLNDPFSTRGPLSDLMNHEGNDGSTVP